MKRFFPGGPAIFCLLLFACARREEAPPRVILDEGVTLPAVSALAWLDSGDSSGENFLAVTEDGTLRIWNIFSGLVSVSMAPDALVPGGSGFVIKNSAGENLTVKNLTSFPGAADSLESPGGTRKISPSGDGGVLLADARTGETAASYYGFGSAGSESSEWLCFVPGGFYNSSLRGAGYFSASGEIPKGDTRRFPGRRPPKEIRKYKLEQLSGALFRPDLFGTALRAREAGGNGAETVFPLVALFREDEEPPLLSVSAAGENSPGLRVTVTGRGGGIGMIALYRRDGNADIPVTLFPPEKQAEERRDEDGTVTYEISLDPAAFPAEFPGGVSAEMGISVFNKSNTIESGRQWIGVSGGLAQLVSAISGDSRPALKALLVSPKDGAGELEDFLSLQKDGALYSGVTVRRVFGENFGKAGFIRTASELLAEKNSGDVIVLYLGGRGTADSRGDLLIVPEYGRAGENAISAFDILEQALAFSGTSLFILLDIESGDSREKIETALLRFQRRLGPKAMLALCETRAGKTPLVSPILEELSAVSGSVETSSGSGGKRYIMVSDFFAGAGKIFGEYRSVSAGAFSLAFPAREDFRIADPLINMGEMKFQTMTSGAVKVDRVDREPVPLAFGNTMIRAFPPGNYIVDMIYRNGYRETRFVNLLPGESVWVVFTYTPALLSGNFSRALPPGGINIAELDPANYEKINREAMEGMGMSPSYVAYLAGEKLYREGRYNQAIAEFSRAISLKPDYAGAYVSRGNARRRTGEPDRAIEDYTRALNLDKEYAEVFNYRGFVYAQKENFGAAIEDYTRAINLKVDYGDAYFNRAYAYGKTENWERAIADYSQVIKLEPANWIAYNERGNARMNNGDETNAALDYAASERLKNR